MSDLNANLFIISVHESDFRSIRPSKKEVILIRVP